MARENFNEIFAFLTVAREGSFTKAAVRLGVSQSALSQTIRGLEARLGVRLLARTTRSVAPTAAGERLLGRLGPRYDDIEAEIAAIAELRDKPAGSLRISSPGHAADMVIWPKLTGFLHQYPDIQVELNVEYRLIDIVAERYDAGVRLGERVAKDMVAVRISPEIRMAVVGSPDYFATRAPPGTPSDLTEHRCINVRLPTHGGLMSWEFEKDDTSLNVQVEGQCVFSGSHMVLRAALAGHGLAYVPEDLVVEHLAANRLVRVLDDWCQPFSGYYLYYPHRHYASPAFARLVDTLRHRK